MSELAVKFGNKHSAEQPLTLPSLLPTALSTPNTSHAWGISFSCPSLISNYDAGCTVINFLWDTHYIEHMNVL